GGDKSVTAGSSITNSITAALVSGNSQAVSFIVSGLPSGATGSFSSASCNPLCITVLTINTTGSTPAGNFPITVTSIGAGMTRTTAFTLSVTLAITVAPPPITPSTGKVYYVGKNGNDSYGCAEARTQSTPKLTIGASVTCAAPGDIVEVLPGTYVEMIQWNTQSIPGGSPGNPIIWRAQTPRTVTIQAPSNASPQDSLISLFTQGWITMSGFIFDANNTAGVTHNITDEWSTYPNGKGANHIRIENSEIKNGVWNCI